MIAAASGADLALVFVLLAIIAFLAAIYVAFRGNWIGGIVLALIGVIILIVAD